MNVVANERRNQLAQCQKEGLIKIMLGKLGDIIHQQKLTANKIPSPAIELALDPTQQWMHSDSESESNVDSPCHTCDPFDDDDADADGVDAECRRLAQLIETTLREAKSGALKCGEVLIPTDLTARVARDVVRMAQNEPCGLRGCVVLFDFENDPAPPSPPKSSGGNSGGNSGGASSRRRIGRLQCDPGSVATFELFLTLRRDTNTWLGLRHMFSFRGCLRKLGNKGPTVVVSPGYTLVKRKLYRSSQQS